jgi:hypothetical protein
MIHRLSVGVKRLLQRDLRGAVPDLAARDVPVLDRDDRAVVPFAAQIVHNDLAAAPEGRSNALRNLLEFVELSRFYTPRLLLSHFSLSHTSAYILT